ncbi:MAG: hypothetical protein Q7R97_02540 [Candidatus Daviesbacteria bacterium]|nr:hypothetical protein [Candidatus Daviesbacteria bacterium]
MENNANNEINISRFEKENVQLAKEIKKLFYSLYLSESEIDNQEAVFTNTSNSDEFIHFSYLKKKEDFTIGEVEIPSGFRFPAYEFEYSVHGIGPNITVATRYGFLPGLFIGSDKKLYETVELYLLNDGQALKYGLIGKAEDFMDGYGEIFPELEGLNDEEIVEYFLESPEYGKFMKVNFTPDVNLCNKPIALETGDYEKIKYVLSQIKSGEWKHKAIEEDWDDEDFDDDEDLN